MFVYVNAETLGTLLESLGRDVFTDDAEYEDSVAAAKCAAADLSKARESQLEVGAIVREGELAALTYALELADTFVSKSDYTHFSHQDADKANLRLAWTLAFRLERMKPCNDCGLPMIVAATGTCANLDHPGLCSTHRTMCNADGICSTCAADERKSDRAAGR